MSRLTREARELASMLLAGLLLAACDSDDKGFPADQCADDCVTGDETLVVAPANALLLVGSERQLMATIVAPDGTREDVTDLVDWESGNSALATVSAGGLVRGVAPGGTQVTAALPKLNARADVAVSNLSVDRVLVSPAYRRLLPGLPQQYTAAAVLTDGTNVDVTTRVTWSVGSPAVATIDAAGLARALAEGVTSIDARYSVGSTVHTAAATLDVSAPIVTIDTFFVIPLSATTVPGAQVAYRAFVVTSENETLDVTAAVSWASTNTAVAAIDAAGVATAHAPGNTAILARLTHLGRTLFAPGDLTVVAPSLSDLRITPQWAERLVGQEQAYRATAVLSDGATIDVTERVLWESLAPGIASVDPHGVASALAVGQATIAASLTFQGTSRSEEALLIVDAPPPVLQSLSVVPPVASVLVDDDLQYRCIATFSDGSLHDVTGRCLWTVADPAIAVIDGLGGLLTGIAAGSTSVAASWNYQGVSATGATSVEVVAPLTVTGLQVTPASADSVVLGTQQFRAHALLSDGRKFDVTSNVAWTSLDPAVAEVGSVGLARALLPGDTEIRAAGTVAGVEYADAASFTVTPPTITVQEFRVIPPRQGVYVGGTVRFEAEFLLSNGVHLDATQYADWSALVPTVARSTSERGEFVGLSIGTTPVEASISIRGTSFTSTGQLVVLPDIAVRGLEIEPESPLLITARQRQLNAMLLLSSGDAVDVTHRAQWASADSGIATVDAEGLATGIAAGTTDLSAAVIFGAISETDSVTARVFDPALVLVALRVSPLVAAAPIGIDTKFTATAYYLDGGRTDVSADASWTIADTNVAELVSQDGLVRATAPGTTAITAHYNADGTEVLASAVLVVPAPVVTITGIEVTPPRQVVAVGNAVSFGATALLSDGSHIDVTRDVQWRSSDPAIAQATRPAGRFETLAQGMATISATLVHESQIYVGQAALVVQAAQPVYLEVTPPRLGLTISEQGQLNAIVHFTDESTEDVTGEVTWQSQDESIATVGASLRRGVVTGVATGLTAIDAVYRDSLSASAAVRVRAPVLLSIDVLPATTALPAGETQDFTAIGNYDDESALDVTDRVLWTSSDEGIAAIVGGEPQGRALGVAPGTVTISAAFDGVTGSASLTVTPAVAVALDVGPATARVRVDGEQAFIAVATFSDGSRHEVTDEVTWTSSAPLVASVSNRAGSEGVAHGLSAGTAEIRAIDGTLTDFGTLQVLTPIVISLIVTPANETVTAGSNVYYEATLVLNDTTELDVTELSRWTSSDDDVASISNGRREGKATTLEPGITTIRAALGPFSGATNLVVTPNCQDDSDHDDDFDLESVAIVSDVTIRVGETAQMRVIGAYDQDGDGNNVPDCFQDLTDDRETDWDSDDEDVFEIDAKSGIVTGIGPGSAEVDVEYRNEEDSATVTVLP
jgi:uncharacterized protein YjdB